MLAKLVLRLPFAVTILDGAEYGVYRYQFDEYFAVIGPPRPSETTAFDDHLYVMNGAPARLADAIEIVFQKESFDRRDGAPMDPPEDVIRRVLDYVTQRLRYVTRASQVRDIDFPIDDWRMEYLSDDGSELEPQDGFHRSMDGFQRRFDFIGCTPSVWDDALSLPSDFETPTWHELLVEARGFASQQHVGTAVVLAATAHEVFIAGVLEQLSDGTTIPQPLWEWINDRGGPNHWQKEPSVLEQFDTLLTTLSGHSLKKEENVLWEGVTNLREARNKFVHGGVATIGGRPINAADAEKLILKATAVVSKIREWIPEPSRWPEFVRESQFGVLMKLPGQAEVPDPRADDEAASPKG